MLISHSTQAKPPEHISVMLSSSNKKKLYSITQLSSNLPFKVHLREKQCAPKETNHISKAHFVEKKQPNIILIHSLFLKCQQINKICKSL